MPSTGLTRIIGTLGYVMSIANLARSPPCQIDGCRRRSNMHCGQCFGDAGVSHGWVVFHSESPNLLGCQYEAAPVSLMFTTCRLFTHPDASFRRRT